jgi:hypothetical protein
MNVCARPREACASPQEAEAGVRGRLVSPVRLLAAARQGHRRSAHRPAP